MTRPFYPALPSVTVPAQPVAGPRVRAVPAWLPNEEERMKVTLPRPLAVGVFAALAASTGAFALQAAPMPSSPAASQSAAGVTRDDADNTRLNRRDRNDATATPMDQSNRSSAVD